MEKKQLRSLIAGKLSRHYGVEPRNATKNQMYHTCALVVRDLMMEKWNKTQKEIEKKHAKQVCYLSLEFLIGKSLKNNIYNLGLLDEFQCVLKGMGCDLQDLVDIEEDAALGNGGLGRLAACYMDALAAQNLPATGFSILYEYGLFKQRIIEGQQTELPDSWLDTGRSWLIPRTDEAVEVHFGGELVEHWESGHLAIEHQNYTSVTAVPHDMLISGYQSDTVNTLRLWQAKATRTLDFKLFGEGDYLRAIEEQAMAETISKILYPEDKHVEGKSLRLKQQYFFVSASIQNIINHHMRTYGRLDNLPKRVVIQINDTHPTLVIPEMMRIMMDVHGLTWEDAWDITTHTVAYTNHTIMPEALERWSEDLVKSIMPRVYQIIVEINRRFCDDLWNFYPNDWDTISKMAIIAYNEVRMANLAIAGSFSVNGVSALHSQILKDDSFKDFYHVTPAKFNNVTNGIAYRRWMGQANEGLTALVTDKIGPDFLKEPKELKNFAAFAEDEDTLTRFDKIKRDNKERLARYIKEHNGITVDPDSMFDVQAKRLHEYKRQTLNILHILRMYYELKDNPNLDVTPRTFIFGAKAAPGYYTAKQIIRLIHSVADMINNDPQVNDKLKVVFLEDYKVSIAEILMPAANLSEQISTAGREASGTGNMKFMLNGALTIGTMDGANIEICESVGEENMFIFGLRKDEVLDLQRNGYNAMYYYQQNAWLSRILNSIQNGIGRADGPQVSYQDIVHSLIIGNDYGTADPYLVLADFEDYCRVQRIAGEQFKDTKTWNQKAILNVAGAHIFAADRSVQDYNERIWHLTTLWKDKK